MKIPDSIKTFLTGSLLAIVLATLTRIVFYLENAALFQDIEFPRLMELMYHGMHFDIAALIYMNAIWAIMVSIPWKIKDKPFYRKLGKWIFVVMNSLFIIINLIDAVYFPFVGKRTNLGIFREFKGTGNLAGIFAQEFINHWYLVLLGIIMIWSLWRFYRTPKSTAPGGYGKKYYIAETCGFVLMVLCCYIGTRADFSRSNTSVLGVDDADVLVKDRKETALILNTPFNMLRLPAGEGLVCPEYYQGEEKAELDAIYSPVHYPTKNQGAFRNKNVVILILESFGREYSGQLNPDLDGGNYKGYTPFLDSLRQSSLYFSHFFAHSRKSIDGVPAILSSFPKVDQSFMPSSYATNNYETIFSLLHKKGYHTSFFQGAHNGSMGFEAYIRGAHGIDDIFQMKEYGNMDDFDGTWGIWDEPYLQYYAKKLSTFKEPFASSLFTLSSHHPFKIPEKYEGVFPEGEHPLFKCVAYSDHALQKFFDTAKKEPWYPNTLFVICADHSNANAEAYPYFRNSIGIMEIQMMFYTPDGSLKGRRDQIAQQIDILPTVLSYLNYDEPYVAFGNNLLETPAEETWSLNDFNGYQFFYKNHAITWDGQSPQANDLYNFEEDPLKTKNILEEKPELADSMLTKMKSILAQYKDRMINNKIIYSDPSISK